jgi:hypothetical protein
LQLRKFSNFCNPFHDANDGITKGQPQILQLDLAGQLHVFVSNGAAKQRRNNCVRILLYVGDQLSYGDGVLYLRKSRRPHFMRKKSGRQKQAIFHHLQLRGT